MVQDKNAASEPRRILLFEDIAETAMSISASLLSLDTSIEVFWLRNAPRIANPFTVRTSQELGSLIGEFAIFSSNSPPDVGGSKQQLTVWPSMFAGAVLDNFQNSVRIGERLLRWFEFVGFKGPVLLYSTRSLPPLVSKLPLGFVALKSEESKIQRESLARIIELLGRDTPLSGSLGIAPDAAVDQPTPQVQPYYLQQSNDPTAIGPDNCQAFWNRLVGTTRALRRIVMLDTLTVTSIQSVSAIEARIPDVDQRYAPVLIAVGTIDSDTLSGLIDSFLPEAALKRGFIYLDAGPDQNGLLRMVTAVAEDVVSRYEALKRAARVKSFESLESRHIPILARFLSSFYLASAFAGSPNALCDQPLREKRRGTTQPQYRPGWIRRHTGVSIDHNFYKSGYKPLICRAVDLEVLPRGFAGRPRR